MEAKPNPHGWRVHKALRYINDIETSLLYIKTVTKHKGCYDVSMYKGKVARKQVQPSCNTKRQRNFHYVWWLSWNRSSAGTTFMYINLTAKRVLASHPNQMGVRWIGGCLTRVGWLSFRDTCVWLCILIFTLRALDNCNVTNQQS